VCFYPPTQHSNKPHRTNEIWEYGNPIMNGFTNSTKKIIFTPIIRPASSIYITLSFLIMSYFELFTFSRVRYWKPLACVSKHVVFILSGFHPKHRFLKVHIAFLCAITRFGAWKFDAYMMLMGWQRMSFVDPSPTLKPHPLQRPKVQTLCLGWKKHYTQN
jgi:hypothetical protein